MTKDTWREELQNKIQIKVKRLDELVNGNGFVCRQEELINFIQEILDEQKREIVEMASLQKKDYGEAPAGHWSYHYNQALDDIINNLK